MTTGPDQTSPEATATSTATATVADFDTQFNTLSAALTDLETAVEADPVDPDAVYAALAALGTALPEGLAALIEKAGPDTDVGRALTTLTDAVEAGEDADVNAVIEAMAFLTLYGEAEPADLSAGPAEFVSDVTPEVAGPATTVIGRDEAGRTIAMPRVEQGSRAVVTFASWFTGPDGKQYRAAWGPCFYVPSGTALGPDIHGDAKWYLQIGPNDACLIAAGCRVLYAVASDDRPSSNDIYIPEDFPAAGPGTPVAPLTSNTAGFRQIPQGIPAIVTTDEHFFTADGEPYKAVWGPTYYMPTAAALGPDIKGTNRWYVMVGEGTRSVLLAGNHVHFAIPYLNPPPDRHIYIPARPAV